MSNLSPPQIKKLCEVALQLAARKGWSVLTLDQLAKQAKIPVVVIKNHFADITALLPVLTSYVSDQVFAAVGKPDKNAAHHDRLFDLLMARFDVLQAHRKAFLSIIDSIRADKKAALILASAQVKEMRRVLESLGADSATPCRAGGLYLVFLASVRVWKKDETLDMSKTMAALDRYLRYAAEADRLLRAKRA